MSKRYLEGEDTEETSSGTDKVCKLGSEELRNYYKTGDLKEIKLEDKGIECKEKDEDYMKALINIVKSKAPDLGMRNLEGEEEEDNSSKKENDDDITENITTYAKHILPVIVFSIIGILCIPGWIICCFCCCCNCCCCCCCKKPGCKIPCFIISYAMYALVVAVCIYGLSQSNHIFTGVADTECSILKFIDEVLSGESKETKPKWAGIEGIKGILTELNDNIVIMETGTVNTLQAKLDDIEKESDGSGKKKDFLDQFESFSGLCNGDYKTDYALTYEAENSYTQGTYILDIILGFGQFDRTNNVGNPNPSYAYLWAKEYKTVSETADSKMRTANSGFKEILGTKCASIKQSLQTGSDTIDSINSSFDSIKGEISNIIVDYSQTIDEYGKLGVKAVFGVLAIIDLGIAAFVFLLCFCSGKICLNCCCCRCLCKCGVHILWNILALLMIIVFIFGSLIALIGKIGGDTMSLFSYLVSEDNIGEGKDTILLGEAKKKVNICVNGDGNIEKELGFETSSVSSFDEIKDAEANIIKARNEFNSNLQMITYNLIKNDLGNRTTFNIKDFEYFKVPTGGDSRAKLNLGNILEEINEETLSKSEKEKWEFTCTSTYQCKSGTDDLISHSGENICFHPSKCFPQNRDWVGTLMGSTPDTSDKQLYDKIKIITDMRDIADGGSFLTNLDTLKTKYDNFLHSYIDALDAFKGAIQKITEKLSEYTGPDSGLFSFINCKFIGTNLKIILKYLKESLGGDLYTVGICLILVGCSLALAISSTILLIIIINVDIDKKKQDAKEEQIPNYPMNSEGRVIKYNN